MEGIGGYSMELPEAERERQIGVADSFHSQS